MTSQIWSSRNSWNPNYWTVIVSSHATHTHNHAVFIHPATWFSSWQRTIHPPSFSHKFANMIWSWQECCGIPTKHHDTNMHTLVTAGILPTWKNTFRKKMWTCCWRRASFQCWWVVVLKQFVFKLSPIHGRGKLGAHPSFLFCIFFVHNAEFRIYKKSLVFKFHFLFLAQHKHKLLY